LMFIIGLELRPQRLWEMRKSIFVMGSLQVTLCGVLLACIVFFALRNLGIAEQDAYKSIELFRDYDEKLLAQQQSIYNDEQKVYETHRNALAELEHLFESDTQQMHMMSVTGTDQQV
jgi:hypothetical protein